ncbi:MAG: hypothetical protein LAO24_13415 [Acidobacteriia bacterium]|nr:hypothetical protein [Terriglobia bacterium]
MPVRNRLILLVAFSSLAFLAACGNGGNRVTPPPTGSFSNSDLNGTYVFSATGTNASGLFFTAVGSFQANGSGGITGGALDLNDAGLGVLLLTINNSSYKVTSDGRGTATLVTSQGNLGLDFVLTSSSHGLVIRFDNSGSGSGSLDLQSAVTQSQLAGSYALNLSGVDQTFTNPLASVAGFTLDSAGNITTGVQDINDFGTALAALSLSGTVPVGSAGLPGVGQLVTSTTLGTLQFDVFVIDANHIKFIEIDSTAILSGDAFSQSASFPTGPTVFTMAGLDFIPTQPVPFVAGGFMVSDGAGNIMSTSTEDVNDAGNVAQVASFAGSYSPLSGGRSVLTLIGFNNASLVNTSTFAAYPSSGGVQMLEIDGNGITSGFALPQTGTLLGSAQGYGLNLTASNSNGFEEDDIAEFTHTNGNFSGLIDINDQGATTFGHSFTGTYTADSTNSGRAVISTNAFNLVSYVVSGSSVLFIETDSNQVGLGAFQVQTPSTTTMAASHLAALHAASHPHASRRSKRAGRVGRL